MTEEKRFRLRQKLGRPLFWIGYFAGAVVMGFVVTLGVLLALWLFGGVPVAHAAETVIPRAALQYRAPLTREARAVWGMDAPVALFAAQIHTESWWRNDTVSHVGAQGLAQFMPSTAKWLPTVAPETGRPAPFDPRWSLRACVTYDKWLHDRLRPMRAASLATGEHMAFMLSAYNGGLGWVGKDRALAARTGRNPDRWFGHVSDVNAGRNKSAIKENRRYVTLIFQRQSAYVAAGWGPGV